MAPSGLQLRILSAVVIAPIALYVVWQGAPIFMPALVVLCVISLYEWLKLAGKTSRQFVFSVFGALYICASFYCLYTIRMEYGVVMSFLFLAVVWASDIDAYLVGKMIGGARMSPTISPKKTWAGMAGAVISPVLILGAFYFYVSGTVDGGMALSALAGVALGVTAQAGDLLASFLKRQAGAKDSGALIPGHGGLLDRIDSLMLAAPVFLFVIAKVPYVIGG